MGPLPATRGLLDRTIIWNEKQLRALLIEYIDRYNQHRPHRGISQRAPNDTADVVPIGPGHPIQRQNTRILDIFRAGIDG